MRHDCLPWGIPSPPPADGTTGYPAGGRGGEREKQSLILDQAAGLRLLLARSPARVVAVVGARGGLGATSVVVNLASVWAQEGNQVLILDEYLTQNNVANMLALKPRYDLLNVVRGDKSLHDVILRAGNGIQILPVARAMQALHKLETSQSANILDLLAQASGNRDVVLVDAATREGHSLCTSLSGEEPLLLVLNATASGITESYAMLKQMALHYGRRVFDIVVNKVKGELEAKAVFDNMAQVAQRNLRVRLSYMGYIPIDEKLKRATQLRRPVMEAFPAAQSAFAIGELAHNLMRTHDVAEDEESSITKAMQRLIRQARPMYGVPAIT